MSDQDPAELAASTVLRLSTARDQTPKRRQAATILLGDGVPTQAQMTDLDRLAAELTGEFGEKWANNLPGSEFVGSGYMDSAKNHKRQQWIFASVPVFAIELVYFAYQYPRIQDPLRYANEYQRLGAYLAQVTMVGITFLAIIFLWRRSNSRNG